MIKLHHTVFATVFIISGCTNSDNKPLDLSGVPTLEITATHAIEIDQPAKGVSFVPNNVAPWLGRLILNNGSKGISSTDIEGRSAQNVSDQFHTQTLGLARENASGVFLAIKDDLQAFIESDDQGNFSRLSTSGNPLSPKVFCETDTGLDDQAYVFRTSGEITTLSLSIAKSADAISAPVEQGIVSSLPAPENTSICAVSLDRTFAYSTTGTNARLHSYVNGDWQQSDAPTNISAMTPLKLNEELYLLLLADENIYLFNALTNALERRLVVKSGLSIGGLEKTKFIASTTHNFGGAAFSEGLLAFGQADEDRIVFVSRSYLEDLVSDATP